MTRIIAFLAGCGALFAAALGLGHVVGPLDAAPVEAAHQGMGGSGTGGDAMGGPAEPAGHGVGGLEATAGGYALRLLTTSPSAGTSELAFEVVDADGTPVTAYERQHERDLHLVVVRRDLTGFQHVHPRLDRAGRWSVPVELTPGAWRVVADFQPTGAGPLVLGTDLLVGGDFTPEPLGEDRLAAQVDGYDVTLGGAYAAGAETVLTATVLRDGVPVTDLQPYLGAHGHLVALREGDVGYLHVHPDEASDAGPSISFHTTFPTAGRYRLFLDFKHAGAVHTAAFTVTVDDAHGAGTGAGVDHDH